MKQHPYLIPTNQYSNMNREELDNILKKYAVTIDQQVAYIRSAALNDDEIRNILTGLEENEQ